MTIAPEGHGAQVLLDPDLWSEKAEPVWDSIVANEFYVSTSFIFLSLDPSLVDVVDAKFISINGNQTQNISEENCLQSSAFD